MNTLTIAFSPEGPTDVRFLSSIIRRTAEELLSRHAVAEADVLEPLYFPRTKADGQSGAERLLAVARQARGLHCLIVHADADAPTPAAAWAERLQPGWQLIAAEPAAQQQLIGLVPVVMTEAWMLADTALLQEAFDTNLAIVRDLGLPRPRNAEATTDPKEALVQAIQRVQQALPPRRRQSDAELLADLYAQLSDVPLDSLRRLASFRRFEADFLLALTAQGFIQP